MIDILLSTYNGEKYLQDQLDSLLKQKHKDWFLLVRDDGSTDKTVDIIKNFVKSCPEKSVFMQDDLGNVGPAQSFSLLMLYSSSPYIAFCDQDDIWFENKLSLQLGAMKLAEKKHTAESPLLIHTDLIVVDEGLEIVSNSFWKHQKLCPEKMNSTNKLLMQNFVTGCACLANRPLILMSQSVPAEAIMHDWWLALVAQVSGKIINLIEPTIMYRQHDMNDTGAKKWGAAYVLTQLKCNLFNMRASLLKTRKQAVQLLLQIDMTKDESSVVSNYIEMFKLGWFQRRIQMWRNGFLKCGLLRNLAVLIYL